MKQLSENILDITMNSVRAGSPLTDITVKEEGSMLTLVINDRGCGMTPEQVANVTDPFFTTRTTRKVGLGLPFLKMEAELTGGSFSIESTVGVGTCVTASFDMSHIDSIPLGDMPETVMTIVGAAPDKDIVFTHVSGEKEVVLDTRDIRAQLDGVPLDTPEVLLWIRDYLESCYAEVFGN
ncbi:MAG: sensor histidine kinase [Clostridia bacterium]|nr:sensor histidine kinase [Clostridia bacterium]